MGRGWEEELTPAPKLCEEAAIKGFMRGADPLAAAVSHMKIPTPPGVSYFPFALYCADKRPRRLQHVLGGGCSGGAGGCGGLFCREGSLSIPPPRSSCLLSPLRSPSPASQWLPVGSDISDARRKGRAGLGRFGHDDPLPRWIHEEVLARVMAPLLRPGLLLGTSQGVPLCDRTITSAWAEILAPHASPGASWRDDHRVGHQHPVLLLMYWEKDDPQNKNLGLNGSLNLLFLDK